MPNAPLLTALRDPQQLDRLSIPQWDLLIQQARHADLSGYLSHLIEDQGLQDICPAPALDMLEAARYHPVLLQTRARRELGFLRRALEPEPFPLILLKGAAYAAADLPHSRGRLLSDVDILVRREHLEAIEQRLLSQGWEHGKIDSYDQRYYREWMHEIPPLMHPNHGIEVDIHHTLLPLTARVRPDPELLWQESRPVGDGRFRVLSPADMLLHSATHLFYDGEVSGDLRDLVDVHRMLDHFGQSPGFWTALPGRALRLELARPLFYALRYCQRLLGTRIPPEVQREVTRHAAPPAPIRGLMDGLVERALTPHLPTERGTPLAARLLYIRSHWLRMPPGLLTGHLARKALRRLRARAA